MTDLMLYNTCSQAAGKYCSACLTRSKCPHDDPGGAAEEQLKAQVNAWVGGWSTQRWLGYRCKGKQVIAKASKDAGDTLGEQMAKQEAS